MNGNYYKADVITAGDYYPFGMKMPGREYDGINGDSLGNVSNVLVSIF